MAKYICPLCNKIYYNVNDLASCTNKDAKAISDKENKLKATKEEIAKIKLELDKSRREIKQEYQVLSNYVDKYNQLGLKLACLEPGSGAHCATSLSFSDDKNADDFVDLRDLNKCFQKTEPRSFTLYNKSLDSLIDDIFSF